MKKEGEKKALVVTPPCWRSWWSLLAFFLDPTPLLMPHLPTQRQGEKCLWEHFGGIVSTITSSCIFLMLPFCPSVVNASDLKELKIKNVENNYYVARKWIPTTFVDAGVEKKTEYCTTVAQGKPLGGEHDKWYQFLSK